MSSRNKKIMGLILISLFILFQVQPLISSAIESNQKRTKIFLAAKPSRVVTQHYTLLDAKLIGEVGDEWIPLDNELILFYIQIDDSWTLLGEATSDETGHALLEVFIELPQDQYLVKAVFSGDLQYESAEDEKQINVLEEAHDVVLSEPQYIVPWGDQVNFSAIILNSGGNPIPNRAVNFSIWVDTPEFSAWVPLPTFFNVTEDEEGNPLIDMRYELKTDKDGMANYTYTPPPLVGEFDLMVTYKGGKSGGFGEKIFCNALRVIKRTSIIKDSQIYGYYGDPVTLKAVLEDHGGISIANKEVSIYFRETEVDPWTLLTNVNVDNTGKISYIYLPGLDPGTYQIKYEFLGDALYTPTALEVAMEIDREITVINNNYIKIKVAYSDSIDIVAVLTDDEGNFLPDKELKVYVSYNFTTYTLMDSLMTDSEGTISLNYVATTTPGTYSIYLEFQGDTYYQPSQLYGALEITKEHVKIINVGSILYTGPGNYLFEAIIQENDGPAIAGVTVKFYLVSGVEEIFVDDTPSDSAGYASLTAYIDVDTSKVWTIYAKFMGDILFYPGAGHDSILTPPEPGFITMSAKQLTSGLIEIVVLLTDSENNPISDTTVDILITNAHINKIISVDTDVNGRASVTYDPQSYVGTLIITVSSQSSNFEIESTMFTLSTAAGVGTIIDHWIIFLSHEIVWWEWGGVVGTVAGIYAALTAFAVFLAWLEGGNWLPGLAKAGYAALFIASIVVSVATLILDFAFTSQYQDLEWVLRGSISKLGDGDNYTYYTSNPGAGSDYLPKSSVDDKLDEIMPNPLFDEVGIIILGEFYRHEVKAWFDLHPASKNKLFLTVLNYDYSANDRNTYSKGYTVSFGQFALWTARNDWCEKFFAALAPDNVKLAPTDPTIAASAAYSAYDTERGAMAVLFGVEIGIAFAGAGLYPPSLVAVGLMGYLAHRWWLWRCQIYIYKDNIPKWSAAG